MDIYFTPHHNSNKRHLGKNMLGRFQDFPLNSMFYFKMLPKVINSSLGRSITNAQQLRYIFFYFAKQIGN
jgi:hypothetical protein